MNSKRHGNKETWSRGANLRLPLCLISLVLQRHCGMMEAWEDFFLFGKSRFTQCFKVQLYQTGKSWFCVQFCGKNRKQHSVVLLVNDGSKLPLVCHACIEQILQFKVCHWQESEISALVSFYKSALRIQKENVQRVLVSNLPEVSKEFRIFIYFKIA